MSHVPVTRVCPASFDMSIQNLQIIQNFRRLLDCDSEGNVLPGLEPVDSVCPVTIGDSDHQFTDIHTQSLHTYSDATVGDGLTVTGGIVVTSGGVTVSAGGLTVTAGGVTVNGGSMIVKGASQGIANALSLGYSTTTYGGNNNTVAFYCNSGNASGRYLTAYVNNQAVYIPYVVQDPTT